MICTCDCCMVELPRAKAWIAKLERIARASVRLRNHLRGGTVAGLHSVARAERDLEELMRALEAAGYRGDET